MAVNVDEIVSNVTPEPETAGASSAGSAGAPEWHGAAETRQLMARIKVDQKRTAAEGFDD